MDRKELMWEDVDWIIWLWIGTDGRAFWTYNGLPDCIKGWNFHDYPSYSYLIKKKLASSKMVNSDIGKEMEKQR
jgi:hypothetical protein